MIGAGNMAVGIKDIAQKLGVSEATVSLALNGNPLVNAETSKRVKKAAKEMGYRPNPYARKLVLKKSGMIGVVVPDIENVFYASFVHYLNLHSRNTGYSLSIYLSENIPQREEVIIDDLIAAQVEGIIYIPANVPDDGAKQLNKLRDSEIPTISATTAFADFPCIMSDLKAGMAALTAHVLRNGRRRLAYISGPRGVYALDIREEGLREALRENGMDPESVLFFHMKAVTYDCACEAARLIREQYADQVDGIICVNDVMALGVINTLEQHLDIPGALTVTGFDDSIFSIASPIPITTVRQDVEAIAKKSIEVLIDQIQHPNRRGQTESASEADGISSASGASSPAEVLQIVPTHLIIRKSAP